MHFSLFSVHMAVLCGSILLLAAIFKRDWILRNCGDKPLLALYFLAALRMSLAFTPYAAVKIPPPLPLNLFQSLADVPFILSQRRVRFSSIFMTIWACVTLLLFAGFLIVRLARQAFPRRRIKSRFTFFCLLLWDAVCAAFWWNPLLWVSRKGFAAALSRFMAHPGSCAKKPASRLSPPDSTVRRDANRKAPAMRGGLPVCGLNLRGIKGESTV